MKTYKTFKEFKKRLFPKKCLKEKLEKMSVKELGKYHADKILRKINKKLKEI